ncbi:YjjG family noncanonical pyrimidine nucleotidase [Gottfriedia luciferensis]|uniref:YjjG family noncanonical pyrimidine nucleotidase n=1 Tax=Gottfriedia luciferensis TaxID=178774 RepID=UPI000B42E64A|nr:YjjG family noncanonical pyrimidine nucleotidase [Gottfriedia luciferensis]
MKKYETLLLDVDDTLLDFQAAEKVALQKLFNEQNISLTPEMKARYKEINHGLWKSYEKGEISRDAVVNTRFSTLFKEFGREVDGLLLEETYQNFLGEGNQFVEGAFELIKSLQQQFDLYIVTNGVSKTQYKRLNAAGIFPYFKDIFVSEDTGFQKPMKEYFNYVFARIPNFELDKTLIIGDSFSADIVGGANSGIDTCWVNPKMLSNDSDIVPTYEIKKLDELYKILNIEKIKLPSFS